MRDEVDEGAAARPTGPTWSAGEGGVTPNAAFLLIAIGRMTRERAERELESLGLALRYVSALGHLAREPGLSYSELARRAGITTQSMQTTLHHLEQRAAIERRTPPGRGRRAELQLTSNGQALLAQARAVMEAIDHDFGEVLGEGSHATLTALLAQIAQVSRPGA
ncbi:MarR family winged helix-turn-helix transcriptional regulator [Allobranchiibius huperziae]|uniref:DNA-binding MarR family transcriptional regulator n=1 Tax=Allobranchiibius huperziae TaxID=1874116 RepID=A0A853DA87_9MICO|nr:MarR family transcriptional regulator [Allobranchiibius huperziae]NYJ73868.1 DNA-binding MarR family transcriptional regulator [Allobranchiibius huperziae]